MPCKSLRIRRGRGLLANDNPASTFPGQQTSKDATLRGAYLRKRVCAVGHAYYGVRSMNPTLRSCLMFAYKYILYENNAKTSWVGLCLCVINWIIYESTSK